MVNLIFEELLRGKKIVVSGAAGGLGSSIVTFLAKAGAQVIAIDINPSVIRASASKEVRPYVLDLLDREKVDEFFATVATDADGLVNCQGILRVKPALDLSLDDFEASLKINVTSFFTASVGYGRSRINQAQRGSIVNLSSVSSKVSNKGYSAYASSKAAVSQLTKVLALEWAEYGIRVNAIGPAMTETPMTRVYLAEPGFLDQAKQKIPLGRFGNASDLFGILSLLLSESGSILS